MPILGPAGMPLLGPSGRPALDDSCCCGECSGECTPLCTPWKFRTTPSGTPIAGHLEIQENLLGVAPSVNWAITGWYRPYCGPPPDCNVIEDEPRGIIFTMYPDVTTATRDSTVPEMTLELENVGGGLLNLVATLRLRNSDDTVCSSPCPSAAFIEQDVNVSAYECDCIFFGFAYEEVDDDAGGNNTKEPRLHVRIGGNELHTGNLAEDIFDVTGGCDGPSGCRFRPGQINLTTYIGADKPGQAIPRTSFGAALTQLIVWDQWIGEKGFEDLESGGPGNILLPPPINTTVPIDCNTTIDGFEIGPGDLGLPDTPITAKPRYHWCDGNPQWEQNQKDKCASKILTYVP